MQNRKVHIELLRIISIYLVMFNHTGAYSFFMDKTGEPFHYFYLFSSILCKVAVPLFFMISGALLLKREEPIRMLYKKRVIKFVLTLLFVSLFYYMLLTPTRSTTDFVRSVYSTNVITSLWYLYSYIGVLIMLPILRKLAVVLSEKDYCYIFVFQIILVGILPILEILIWDGEVTRNTSFSAVLFTTENVFYVLLGYYCENVLDIGKISSKVTVVLSAAAIGAISIMCFVTDYWVGIIGSNDLNDIEQMFETLLSVPCFAIYVLMRKRFEKGVRPKVETAITTLGGSVFGAYLIEKLFRLVTGFVYRGMMGIFGAFWASVVWVSVGMTGCLLLVSLLKKILATGKLMCKIV